MTQGKPAFLPNSNSKYVTIFGFGMVLVLMSVMVLIGLTQLSAVNQRLLHEPFFISNSRFKI